MTDFSFDLSLWHSWNSFNYWFLTVLGFISALAAYNSYDPCKRSSSSIWSLPLMLFLLFVLGLFPIEWGWHTDRENYANTFLSLQQFGTIEGKSEIGFITLARVIGLFVGVKSFFFILTLIYLANYYIAAKRLVKTNSFWLLVGIVISMGFTSYVLNTMRAGLALSFIFLAISLYPSRWKMLIAVTVGTLIHNSAAIPGAIMLLCTFVNKPRWFYTLWFIAIPVSFVFGGFFMNLFAGMSADDRTHYLTEEATHYNAGFRIDFILYSLAPIVVGGYYIFRKKLGDNLYSLIYNTYLLTNIFWILVIKANYSDRFAYLSWFLIPLVLLYPLLKRNALQKTSIKENVWVGAILFGESLFRFVFN